LTPEIQQFWDFFLFLSPTKNADLRI